jgi:hypothetical protein
MLEFKLFSLNLGNQKEEPMDVYLFKAVALLYTTLIICGTMLVPGYIVNSKIALLKELLLANPDTALVEIEPLQNFNKLPEKDLQLIESKTLWKA